MWCEEEWDRDDIEHAKLSSGSFNRGRSEWWHDASSMKFGSKQENGGESIKNERGMTHDGAEQYVEQYKKQHNGHTK